MNILLTSGDGWQADGLAALRRALMNSGFNILTVVSDERSSNMSRARSASSIAFERMNRDVRHPIYRATGSPADCVHFAILSGLAREVSVVIAGIGEDSALGDDATCSSTFGAAAEGALLGYPAMAVFQERAVDQSPGALDNHRFEWAGVIAAELAAWMIAAPPPERGVLNVNIPTSLVDRHLQLTSLAQRIWNPDDYIVSTNDNIDEPIRVSKRGEAALFDLTPHSDALALANGQVSITPINLEFQRNRAPSLLNGWLRTMIAGINPRIGASSGNCVAGCCG